MMYRLQPLYLTQLKIVPKAQIIRCLATNIKSTTEESNSFETVFSFPFVKYFGLFNRIKLYHIATSSIAIPTCGLLEWSSLVPQDTFLSAAYVGVTVGCLLSIASLPFTNIIGFLYINKDNSYIKISAIDYWGRRKDQIVHAKDWVPLLDIQPRPLDVIYLRPKLTDGSTYKLFIRFGNVLNSQKMAEVLE